MRRLLATPLLAAAVGTAGVVTAEPGESAIGVRELTAPTLVSGGGEDGFCRRAHRGPPEVIRVGFPGHGPAGRVGVAAVSRPPAWRHRTRIGRALAVRELADGSFPDGAIRALGR